MDVISTSFGAIGSNPVPGIEDATKVAVVDKHKLHTGAADNSPSPAIQDATAGPPWSIGIAGYAEEGDDQKEIMSGSIRIYRLIGHNICQIMMILTDIMKPQGHLLRHQELLELSHMFYKTSEMNLPITAPVHLKNVAECSYPETISLFLMPR